MLLTLMTTMALLLALMTGWILVQRAARRVAEQHPEAGPLRLVGGGCGGQGHGHEPEPPSGRAAAVASARGVTGPTIAGASTAPPAEGCASCANTACKPGQPIAAGAPMSCASAAQLHPLLAD